MQPDLKLGYYKHISGTVIRAYSLITNEDSQELMVLYGIQEPTLCISISNFCESFKFVSLRKPRKNVARKPRLSFREIAHQSQQTNKTECNLYGLSSAEILVAEGIVEGKNARAIAQRLYISHKTVDSHLSTIYHKLGIADNRKVCHIVVAANMLRQYFLDESFFQKIS